VIVEKLLTLDKMAKHQNSTIEKSSQ